MNKILFVCAGLFAAVGAARAQSYPETYLILPAPAPAPWPAHLVVGVGASGGGDELASARYPDGTTAHIHAGGLVYLTAGVDYHLLPELSLQGTINYHVDSAETRHGDVRFERFPIELIAYYQPNPAFRIGGGVRYTMSPKLTGSAVGEGRDVSFDNTTSAVVEAEYFQDADIGVKLRYVHETFKAPGLKQVDGSHVGLSVNFYF
jgi:hypothetical protein